MAFELADELRSRIVTLKKENQEMICKDVDASDEIGILWSTAPNSAYKCKLIKCAEYCSAYSMPLFIIVMWKVWWDKANTKEQDYELLHNLLHMGYDETSGRYYIRKHDIEEFKQLVGKKPVAVEKLAEEKEEKTEVKKK